MEFNKLNDRKDLNPSPKAVKAMLLFKEYLKEISSKELTENIIELINTSIEEINTIPNSNSKLIKHLRNSLSNIIKVVEKEIKVVPKNYYRNIWLAIGMAGFGIPIGVVFGSIQDNMSLLAVGLPFGLAIGGAVGAQMDKKAFKEGRQLNVEISY